MHLELPFRSLVLLPAVSVWGMLKDWWDLASVQLQGRESEILANIFWPHIKLSIPQLC